MGQREGAVRVKANPGALYSACEPLVLASASPRRRELLAGLGLRFRVVPSPHEEPPVGARPEMGVRRSAFFKARSVAEREPSSWVLGADTVVVLGGLIFGKPGSPEEAARMLRSLSGRSHSVFTAVCLIHMRRGFSQMELIQTRVEFRELSEAEIAAYVRTGEPMDKAGAYGIQGLGAAFVKGVSGSYTNVVGLPLAETLTMLQKNGVIAPAASQ